MAYHNFTKLCDYLPIIKGEKAKTVCHLHCLAEMHMKREPFEEPDNHIRIFRQMANDPSIHFVAVSDAVKASFEKYANFNGNIQVISNGVSDKIYDILDREEKRKFREEIGIKGRYILGYVGRIDNVKGDDITKEILKQAENSPDLDYGFVFACSDGRDRQSFVEWIEKNAPRLVAQDRIKVCIDVTKLINGNEKLNDEVKSHFYKELQEEGFTTQSKAYAGVITKPLQPHLDFYFQTSRSEAISLSILEALMSGVPVIASNIGGIPQIVNFNNGCLVDVAGRPAEQCANDFVEGINKLIEGRDWMKASNYREAIRTNLIDAGYTASDMVRKYDDLYSSL